MESIEGESRGIRWPIIPLLGYFNNIGATAAENPPRDICRDHEESQAVLDVSDEVAWADGRYSLMMTMTSATTTIYPDRHLLHSSDLPPFYAATWSHHSFCTLPLMQLPRHMSHIVSRLTTGKDVMLENNGPQSSGFQGVRRATGNCVQMLHLQKMPFVAMRSFPAIQPAIRPRSSFWSAQANLPESSQKNSGVASVERQ